MVNIAITKIIIKILFIFLFGLTPFFLSNIQSINFIKILYNLFLHLESNGNCFFVYRIKNYLDRLSR
jgi:hypothetical protein